MTDTKTEVTCLNCGNKESQVPMISIRFGGKPLWVCSQCMPVLIHEPNALAAKLAALEGGEA